MMYDRNKIKDANNRLKYWIKTNKINRSFPNLQALTTCKYKIRLQVTLLLNVEITVDPAGFIEGNYLNFSDYITSVLMFFCCDHLVMILHSC